MLPFVVTVNPKLVEAPAARVPFQAGLTVITSPEVVGVPFQTAETFWGEGTVTGTVQVVMPEPPAFTVTSPLYPPFQVEVWEYVAVQAPMPSSSPPPSSPPPLDPPSAASTASYAGFLL